jgi:hypothetical protein
MQYTFSYFYWLMSKKKDVNYTEIFGMADSNRDGLLNDNEVREHVAGLASCLRLFCALATPSARTHICTLFGWQVRTLAAFMKHPLDEAYVRQVKRQACTMPYSSAGHEFVLPLRP